MSLFGNGTVPPTPTTRPSCRNCWFFCSPVLAASGSVGAGGSCATGHLGNDDEGDPGPWQGACKKGLTCKKTNKGPGGYTCETGATNEDIVTPKLSGEEKNPQKKDLTNPATDANDKTPSEVDDPAPTEDEEEEPRPHPLDEFDDCFMLQFFPGARCTKIG